MGNSKIVLGIDTSNYTTSVACFNESKDIVLDRRIPLTVKQGERGLRQSHALFQHMENLPELLETVLTPELSRCIAAVAVSSRPRPVEGSYMPVFKGGLQFARVLASAYGVPHLTFSHQEGHLAAAAYETPLDMEKPYLAYHLSGGTCELLFIEPGLSGTNPEEAPLISIIGGTKDISFGQVLDRIGVAMGLSFPCGKELDQLALSAEWNPKADNTEKSTAKDWGFSLKDIPLDGLFINLSGLETQAQRALEQRDRVPQCAKQDKDSCTRVMARLLLQKTADCLCTLTQRAAAETGVQQILFTGGVSASRFLRNTLQQRFHKGSSDTQIFFGDPALSSDNAVGISILGGQRLWH